MSFYKKFTRFAGLLCSIMLMYGAQQSQAQATKGYYLLKVYHVKDKAQTGLVDSYLKDFYVPELHKLNIKDVGIFKTFDKDTADKRVYVFIYLDTWKKLEALDGKVNNAAAKAGRDFIDADYKNPPYIRMEAIILNAFSTRPKPAVPKLTANKADRVYELRSYESATEKYHHNKVSMFNNGETDLFDRIGANPVFYGSVIAGSHMPNLMYMTAYNSMQDRDKHWEVFSAAPEWKALVAKEEYKNNVSRNDITFLYPAEYSDY